MTDALDTLRQWGWVDKTLLVVMTLSVLMGLWRGFVFEIVSLLGWLVAYVLANLLGPMAAAALPEVVAAPALRLGLAYALVFLTVLVLCQILARMMRALVSATPLTVIDRLLGAAFGFARGALVLVVVATLVMLSPFARSAAWRDSQGALWLGQALEGLKPLLPQSLNAQLRA